MSKQSSYSKNKCLNIVGSVRRVLKDKDITKLTKSAYNFIHLRMGFIAHYDLNGFVAVYKEIGINGFAKNLITGESSIHGYNRDHAKNFANGVFENQYTKKECQNISTAMFNIIALAETYLDNNL